MSCRVVRPGRAPGPELTGNVKSRTISAYSRPIKPNDPTFPRARGAGQWSEFRAKPGSHARDAGFWFRGWSSPTVANDGSYCEHDASTVSRDMCQGATEYGGVGVETKAITETTVPCKSAFPESNSTVDAMFTLGFASRRWCRTLANAVG